RRRHVPPRQSRRKRLRDHARQQLARLSYRPPISFLTKKKELTTSQFLPGFGLSPCSVSPLFPPFPVPSPVPHFPFVRCFLARPPADLLPLARAPVTSRPLTRRCG